MSKIKFSISLNPTINFSIKNERGNSIGGTEKEEWKKLRRKLHPEGSLLFQANPLIPDPIWEARNGISFLGLPLWSDLFGKVLGRTDFTLVGC